MQLNKNKIRQVKQLLETPVIESIEGFNVVRDDYLVGGTKVRYILPYLDKKPEQIVVYASPAEGYAQVALSVCCNLLNKKAVIFVAKRKVWHENTKLAQKYGAEIIEVPHGYLSNVQHKAKIYVEDNKALLVPFGINVPEAINEFKQSMQKLDIMPEELWCVAGSGVLSTALHEVWPEAQFNAVQVGAKIDLPFAKVFIAPEKFKNKAKDLPPYPSCIYYDAKLWQFVKEKGSKGAFIWNVAP